NVAQESSAFMSRNGSSSGGMIKSISQSFLLRDVSWIYAAFFLITLTLSGVLSTDPGTTIFRILFEIISAYGTVGLSIGYPGIATSFCATWGAFAIFLLVVIMILGRHRGLPDSVDAAVQLPAHLLSNKQDKTIVAPEWFGSG